jgi:peptidoglycan/LPS O-acetylase OafA/YrhL
VATVREVTRRTPRRIRPPVPVAGAARPGEFLAGDGIRGVGMVCIIVAHLSGAALVVDGAYAGGFKAGYGAITGTVLAGLQLALPLFFVLSGYLISRPFVRAFLLDRKDPSLVAYLRHRCARILPVFWLLGGLMLAYYGALGSTTGHVIALFGLLQIYLPANGFLNFLGQAWTIDMEVAFYVSVPLGALLLGAAVRRWAARRPGSPRMPSMESRAALLVGLLTAVTLVSAWLRSITIDSRFWALSPPSTFYYFGPGVALAALEVRFAAALGRGRAPRLASVLGLAAVVIAVTLAVIAPAQDDHRLISFPGAVAVTFGAACAFGALLVLQLARGACPRLLSNRVSRWLGARSYPAYIIQSAVIAEALRLDIGHPGGPRRTLVEMAAFGLPLTLAAASLVHATIERPVLAWAHSRGRAGGPRPPHTVPPESLPTDSTAPQPAPADPMPLAADILEAPGGAGGRRVDG